MSDNVTVSYVHDLIKKGQDFVFVDVRNLDQPEEQLIRATDATIAAAREAVNES